MLYPYTSLFFAAYCSVFIALSVMVIRHRRATKAPINNPHHDEMLARKIRVHGNFAEYTPMMLIGLFLLEAAAYHYLVMVLAIAYFTGRGLHAYGLLSAEPQKQSYQWRVAGMVTTFFCLGTAAGVLLVTFFLAPA